MRNLLVLFLGASLAAAAPRIQIIAGTGADGSVVIGDTENNRLLLLR
jgi:hypothetical protein